MIAQQEHVHSQTIKMRMKIGQNLVNMEADLSEMQIPRDWDDSGSIDSDEFSTDQNDGACFTFALVNTEQLRGLCFIS